MKKLSEQEGLAESFIEKIPPTDRQASRVPKGHDTEADTFNAAAIEVAEEKMGVRIPEAFLGKMMIYQVFFGGVIFEVTLSDDTITIFIVDEGKTVLSAAYDVNDYSRPPELDMYHDWHSARAVEGLGDIWEGLSDTELDFITNTPGHV